METKTISVVVPKETQELSEGIVTFLTVCKEALDDGFQLGQDGAVILAALVAAAPAFNGIDKIPEEVKHTKEFATAAALFGTSVLGIWKKSPTEPQA